MANEVSYTASLIRHIGDPSDIIRCVAHEAMDLGQPVIINSDGEAALADASTVAGANMVGIPVYAGFQGATAAAAGDTVGVAIGGIVDGYSGMTPGNTIWISDTTGRLSTVVGTKSGVAGIAKTASQLIVRPGLFVVSS